MEEDIAGDCRVGLDDSAAAHVHSFTGRPLGDESFLKRIDEAIERAIRAKSVGRPKGSKDKVKRKVPRPK